LLPPSPDISWAGGRARPAPWPWPCPPSRAFVRLWPGSLWKFLDTTSRRLPAVPRQRRMPQFGYTYPLGIFRMTPISGWVLTVTCPSSRGYGCVSCLGASNAQRPNFTELDPYRTPRGRPTAPVENEENFGREPKTNVGHSCF